MSWKTVLHRTLGPIAFAWMDAHLRRLGEFTVPGGLPVAHGSGPDPDRVLLVGGPRDDRLGVMSYDLALGGYLARQLAKLTGRGADVQTRAGRKFRCREVVGILQADADLNRFDVVVIMIGLYETLTVRPLELWTADVRRLVAAIEATVGVAGPPVLIVGLPRFERSLDLRPRLTRWVGARIDRLNTVMETVCAGSDAVEFVPFHPTIPGIQSGSDLAVLYSNWATALTPIVASALADSRSRVRLTVKPDDARRVQSLKALGLTRESFAPLNRIVEMACTVLGTDAAAVNFIDHELQWTKSSSGIELSDVPREQAICNVTIQSGRGLVLADLASDPDFAESDWVSEHDLRFYAGYPLETPDGARVGALCVMGRRPGTFSEEDEATLRDLALQAQAVLWERVAS